MKPGTRLTTEQAATFLTARGCPGSAKTLEKWRYRGEGPRYYSVGSRAGKRSRVVYAVEDLSAFAEGRASPPQEDKRMVEDMTPATAGIRLAALLKAADKGSGGWTWYGILDAAEDLATWAEEWRTALVTMQDERLQFCNELGIPENIRDCWGAIREWIKEQQRRAAKPAKLREEWYLGWVQKKAAQAEAAVAVLREEVQALRRERDDARNSVRALMDQRLEDGDAMRGLMGALPEGWAIVRLAEPPAAQAAKGRGKVA